VLRCGRTVCSALLIGGGVIPVASAQAPGRGSISSVIATDRPAFTDSSAVVPDKVFQAENGLLDTSDQARRTLDFPETLIRIGIGPSTELRFTAPDYTRDYEASTGLRSNFGDLALGVKQQLPSPFGLELAAVLSLSLPTGAAAVSGHGYDPSFQLPWSHKLASNCIAAGMPSLYVPAQNGAHSVVGESTFLVDRQLNKDWGAFAEYAGDFPQAGGPRDLLHFGTAYRIAAHYQLDLHVGVGLSTGTADHLVGIGYSFRFRMAGRSSLSSLPPRGRSGD